MGPYTDQEIREFRRETGEDLTEECDRCGEVYTAEFINGYLRTEVSFGELLRVCCPEGVPDES